MFIYLYKITNLLNNKIYVGIHQTTDLNDGYMGSGTAIRRAIKKYGIDNFHKEIVDFFDTYAAALQREQEIVTVEFILREDTYNLRTGGMGGFEHVNFVPKSDRVNIKEYKRKVSSGEIKVGGTQHWTEHTFNKVRETGWSNLVARGIVNPNTWDGLTEAERQARANKISEKVTGQNNGSYGTHIYVSPSIDKLPESAELNKNRFQPGKQPAGWITVGEWREGRKNKKSGAYGRKWFNDGRKNYYLYPADPQIDQLNLALGRLNVNGCCGFTKEV